jgi:integrase
MNHKAKILEWKTIGRVLAGLQEKERWDDLLLIAAACFTGCRPGDWTKFTWNIFLDANGKAKKETMIVEKKQLNMAKSRAEKNGTKFKIKERQLFLVPQFRSILELCWNGKKQPYLTTYMFRGKSGPNNTSGGISTQGANDRHKRLSREFGLDPDITNYFYRRTAARRIYDSQEDHTTGLRLAQTFMNHTSPTSTAHYIGLTEDEARKSFEMLTF